MNLKNYINIISKYLIYIIIYILLISLLYYIKIFNFKTIRILNYLINILLFLSSGYKIAAKEQRKGYLNGFLLSLILIIIFLIPSIFISKINFTTLVYYLSLITSSIIGGIIGVTKKSK